MMVINRLDDMSAGEVAPKQKDKAVMEREKMIRIKQEKVERAQQIQVKREMFEEREQGQMGVVATGEVVLCNHISKNVVIYLI